MAVARCTANKLMSVAQLRLANLIFKRHSGYSPVDRESDRKTLQRSDGHWFDSGRLNIFCVALAHSEPCALLLQSFPRWQPSGM